MPVRSRSPFWFGEGDARIYIDGEEESSIQGTGTEDYRGLMLILTHAPDYGIYCIYLDRENIRLPEDYIDPDKPYEIDFYSEQMGVKEIYMGSLSLPVGTHTLRFECAGKNPYSKGYLLGLDSVRLRERWEKKRKSLR